MVIVSLFATAIIASVFLGAVWLDYTAGNRQVMNAQKMLLAQSSNRVLK